MVGGPQHMRNWVQRLVAASGRLGTTEVDAVTLPLFKGGK